MELLRVMFMVMEQIVRHWPRICEAAAIIMIYLFLLYELGHFLIQMALNL